MVSMAKPSILSIHHHITTSPHKRYPNKSLPITKACHSSLSEIENKTDRRKFLSLILLGTSALGLQATQPALAENWGVRSFLREHFFEPSLSPEDAVARIRQTTDGMHSIREMLETTSWRQVDMFIFLFVKDFRVRKLISFLNRYVMFYIRVKSAYLNQDLKTVLTIMPDNRRESYVEKANELVDNMAELDYYVRTPKIYESYLYYEKTLKSLDDVVALLA
ncbi:hypothetical protein ACHQM5_008950 [Ranunculus cassubicifolius]